MIRRLRANWRGVLAFILFVVIIVAYSALLEPRDWLQP